MHLFSMQTNYCNIVILEEMDWCPTLMEKRLCAAIQLKHFLKNNLLYEFLILIY